MDFGLLSVLLDSVIQASAMVGEHSDRRKQQKLDHLTSAIQQLDIEAVAGALRPAKLAAYMRGGVDAAAVAPIIKSPSFRGLIKEMFLAVVTDIGRDKLDKVEQSMALVIMTGLRRHALEADLQYFSENVVASLRESCEAIVSAVRASNPETLVALQGTALLKRLTSVLENIDRHQASLLVASSIDAVEHRREWLSTYRRLCEKDHGHIVPPDFDTSRKIPMSKLYVTPTISTGGADSYRGGTTVDFKAFRDAIDRTVLLGDPGGGKSTLTNYLTSYWATEEEGKIPFHVTLREYAKQPEEMSIAAYIEHQLDAHYQHAAPPGLVEDLLISGEAVVIFDGLDELIDSSKRRGVSGVVELFGVKYPLAAIIVTSRRIGYDQARLDPEVFRVCVISEFRDNDVRDYVRKWFASQDDYSDQEAERLAASFIEQSESVPDLRTNPLMLALMCIIFRGENFIPRNRPAVYEKCSTLLFEKWDGHRAIEVPLEARAHVNAALMYVAYWMLLSGSGDVGVSYEKLVREMSAYLRGRAFETEDSARRAATEFVDYCQGRAWVFADAGTTAEGEPLFTFTHRTFMEYFAAFHLTRIYDTPEKLARALLPKVAAEEWDVVAQLAIQIEDKAVDRGSERALRVMLDEPRKRTLNGRLNVLQFVGRCAFFSTLSPSFMRDLTERAITIVMDHLLSADVQQIPVIGPWLSVLTSAVIAHKDTTLEVHRTCIAAALEEPGSDRWKAGCEFICLAIGVVWPTALGSNSAWATWWSSFEAIARSFASDLTAYVTHNSSCRPALVVSGVLSVEAALKAYEDEGASFAETFFAVNDSLFRFFMIPNLAAIFLELARSSRTDEGVPALACAEPLAEEFLRRFWSDEVKTIGGASLDRFSSRSSLYDNVAVRKVHPQSVLDAAVLGALAEHEILMHIHEGRYPTMRDGFIGRLIALRQRKRSSDEADFTEAPLSDKALEFVKEWTRHRASVFDDSGTEPLSKFAEEMAPLHSD